MNRTLRGRYALASPRERIFGRSVSPGRHSGAREGARSNRNGRTLNSAGDRDRPETRVPRLKRKCPEDSLCRPCNLQVILPLSPRHTLPADDSSGRTHAQTGQFRMAVQRVTILRASECSAAIFAGMTVRSNSADPGETDTPSTKKG